MPITFFVASLNETIAPRKKQSIARAVQETKGLIFANKIESILMMKRAHPASKLQNGVIKRNQWRRWPPERV